MNEKKVIHKYFYICTMDTPFIKLQRKRDHSIFIIGQLNLQMTMVKKNDEDY